MKKDLRKMKRGEGKRRKVKAGKKSLEKEQINMSITRQATPPSKPSGVASTLHKSSESNKL